MEVGSLTRRVSSNGMQAAVIIPARDEQGTIGEVVAGARRALPGARLIVVDDASRDDTARIARDQGADVVSLRRRAGYSGALHAGYREAMGSPVGAVLQMDADGQHRPCDLPGLIDALGRADIVLGSRFLGPSPGYRIPRLRRAGMHLVVQRQPLRMLVQSVLVVHCGSWSDCAAGLSGPETGMTVQ